MPEIVSDTLSPTCDMPLLMLSAKPEVFPSMPSIADFAAVSVSLKIFSDLSPASCMLDCIFPDDFAKLFDMPSAAFPAFFSAFFEDFSVSFSTFFAAFSLDLSICFKPFSKPDVSILVSKLTLPSALLFATVYHLSIQRPHPLVLRPVFCLSVSTSCP